jgi:hypothetical protein
MPNQVQTLKSSTPGGRPAGRLPGELYVNWADKQIGVIDPSNNPMDLVAIRNFSSTANYGTGDHVIYLGILYRALAASNPGPFNPANWASLGGSVTLSATPPATPQVGQLWFDSVGGQLYVYYNDGNSSQWVIAVNSGSGITDAPVDSTVYARSNNAWVHITHTAITDWSASLAPYALTTSVPAPSGSAPLMNGTANVGTSSAFARGDHVHPTDTSRAAQASLASYLPLTGGTLSGQLNGTVGNFSSNVYGTNFLGSGAVYPNYNANTTSNLNSSTTSITMVFDGNNYISAQGNVAYIVAAGNSCSWNGTTFTANYLQANTQINTPNLFVSGVAYFANGTTGNLFYAAATAANRSIQWSSQWVLTWQTSTGLMYYACPAGAMHQWDGSGNYSLGGAGNGFKSGGGAWAATSDDRTKRNVAPYASGLDEILQLEPIAYCYNGQGGTTDNGIVYYGLSAQATKPVMPELVIEMDQVKYDLEGQPLPRADTMLEGQLGTELGPLTLALVNAVKTLAARVAELEAAR